tara:strand:+ start:1308 stop:1463 length:156 start_codon:yes stop_codon:yes gene_type:complete
MGISNIKQTLIPRKQRAAANDCTSTGKESLTSQSNFWDTRTFGRDAAGLIL